MWNSPYINGISYSGRSVCNHCKLSWVAICCTGWRLCPGPSSLCVSWETSSTVTRPKPLTCPTWTSRLWRNSTKTKRWSRSLVETFQDDQSGASVTAGSLLTFYFFLQPRSMTPSWPQSLSSSRSLESWVLGWTRLASSLPCSLTMRTWTQRSMRSNPPSSSRWRRCVSVFMSVHLDHLSVTMRLRVVGALPGCSCRTREDDGGRARLQHPFGSQLPGVSAEEKLAECPCPLHQEYHGQTPAPLLKKTFLLINVENLPNSSVSWVFSVLE